MAEKPKAGDVGGRVNFGVERRFRSRAVEREHGLRCRAHGFLARLARFERRRNDARAQTLGQNQSVSGARAVIGQNALRVDNPRHGVAKLDLLVADRVAADHRAARLLHLGKTAREDLFENRHLAADVGKSHDGKRRNRPPTHGVNVAQRICRRYLAKGVGVVHDGREEVHRLYQGQIGPQSVHSGVVGGVEANQDVRVGLFRELGEHRVQNPWTQLGRSTRRLHHAGELGHFAHRLEL